MKALQCVELGGVDKLEINEVSSPDVEPGQVLIDVKAASVNFPDVLICLLYTSPSPRDNTLSRMPSSA